MTKFGPTFHGRERVPRTVAALTSSFMVSTHCFWETLEGRSCENHCEKRHARW